MGFKSRQLIWSIAQLEALPGCSWNVLRCKQRRTVWILTSYIDAFARFERFEVLFYFKR